ncbi:hypothetical protein R84981_002863 [Carnimonas sp. R-84981]
MKFNPNDGTRLSPCINNVIDRSLHCSEDPIGSLHEAYTSLDNEEERDAFVIGMATLLSSHDKRIRAHLKHRHN